MASDDDSRSESLSASLKRERSPSLTISSNSDDAKDSNRKRRRHDNLSLEVCESFVRGACPRSEFDCPFAHPSSAVIIDRDKVTVCYDSLRNKCTRGRFCRYFHAPPQMQDSLREEAGIEEVSEVCQDFLRGKCNRNVCKFSHALINPVPQAIQYLGASVPLTSYPQPVNDREVCRDFLKKSCSRDSCKYAHPKMALRNSEATVVLPNYLQQGNDQETLQVCRDFLKNACNRDYCKYAHPKMVHLQRELPVKLQSSALLGNGALPVATLLYHDAVPICMDFLKNDCNRISCKYFHLIPQSKAYLPEHGTLVKSALSPGHDDEQECLPVCMDFLKNACQRSSCKFAHPNSHTKVADNQVEICRDFRHGRCHRATCRFYHPNTRRSKK